jgi:hypothetical protein
LVGTNSGLCPTADFSIRVILPGISFKFEFVELDSFCSHMFSFVKNEKQQEQGIKGHWFEVLNNIPQQHVSFSPLAISNLGKVLSIT